MLSTPRLITEGAWMKHLHLGGPRVELGNSRVWVILVSLAGWARAITARPEG